MSNSIRTAIDAAGFHGDSTTDAHDIDHGVVADRKAGDGEEKDLHVEAESQDNAGTATEHGKLHTGTGSKSPSPFWLFKDFAWNKGVNKITGETYWNLNPLADVVARVISYCPGVVEDAYLGLSDEDKASATAFGMSLRDLCTEGEQIDSWLERTATYAFAKDAAKNAASAVKWTLAQDEAAARGAKDKALEHGERANKAGRTAAMLKLALITADPKLTINFKGGAWELYKNEAFRRQKEFMNPDEQATSEAAANVGSKAGGFTLRAKAG